jgi:Tfp pilus assembly protein PilO
MAVFFRVFLIISFIVSLAAVPAVRAGWKDILKKTADSLDKDRAKKRAKKKKRRTKAVAAVRGIGCGKAEVEAAAKDSEARDFATLELMLDAMPSEEEVDDFISEGGL